MKHVNTGDGPVRFGEYQFSLPEAAEMAGVSPGSLRNWMVRDIIKIGKKGQDSRWAFNVFDVLQLAVMRDLCVQMMVPPLHAVTVATIAAELAKKRVVRDAAGDYISDRSDILLVNFDADSKPTVKVTDLSDPGLFSVGMKRGGVFLPIVSMLHEAQQAAEDVLERRALALQAEPKPR